jgi:hypothetical protein
VLIAIIGLAHVATAQGNGQLCVRSFEDRNGNGQLDGGEPLLTRGISINLMDANNVTIASALLEQSPTAAQGVVCFPSLTAGQYTVAITSADYSPTTPTTITTAINEGGLPAVVQFGARLAASAQTPAAGSVSTSSITDRDQLARLIISVLGALLVVAGMLVLGVIVYGLAFRNRKPPIQAAMDPRRTTGSMSAVRARETDEHPKI